MTEGGIPVRRPIGLVDSLGHRRVTCCARSGLVVPGISPAVASVIVINRTQQSGRPHSLAGWFCSSYWPGAIPGRALESA